MRKFQSLIILSTLIITACGAKGNSAIEPATSEVPVSSIISEISSVSEEQPSSAIVLTSREEQLSSINEISSNEIISSSIQTISSSEEQSSSEIIESSSEEPSTSYVEDTILEVSFYNPSCGSMSTEVLNERLAAYINEVANTTLVTSISNSKCQISNDIPTKGNKVLIIGAASSIGSLNFTFSESIKMITITAQTYYKPYTDYQTGNEVPNVDANSVLKIESAETPHGVNIDLSPNEGQPLERVFSVATNSKTLKLSTVNEEKGRVFIKGITFVF